MNAVPRNQREAPDEFKQAMISIWWDMVDCPLPQGCDVAEIKNNVRSVLQRLGYLGPISFFAYGDLNGELQWAVETLERNGVKTTSIPFGVKDTSMKTIISNMLIWMNKNKTPATYLLMAMEEDYTDALLQLKMRNNNILLAYPVLQPLPTNPLVCAVDTILHFSELLNGNENIL